MSYKSPIDVIQKQIRVDIDNAIYKAVQTVEINVDREELIKALQYDRNQYDKGCADGCKDTAKEILQDMFYFLDGNSFWLSETGYEVHYVKLDDALEFMRKKAKEHGVEVDE